MPNFDSGVASYVHGTATVEVWFPVDDKGRADVSCKQCRYFRVSSNSCALNGEMCAYPTKFVGAWCPLQLDEKTEGGNIDETY